MKMMISYKAFSTCMLTKSMAMFTLVCSIAWCNMVQCNTRHCMALHVTICCLACWTLMLTRGCANRPVWGLIALCTLLHHLPHTQHMGYKLLQSDILWQPPFNGLCPGLAGWASTRKVKPVWILLKQKAMSGSGVCWATCKPAPHCRQITKTEPYRSVFYRLDAFLPPNQQHHSTKGNSAILWLGDKSHDGDPGVWCFTCLDLIQLPLMALFLI